MVDESKKRGTQVQHESNEKNGSHPRLRSSLNSIFPSTSSDPWLAASLGVLNPLIPNPVKLSLPRLSGLSVFFLRMLLPLIGSPGTSLHLPKLLIRFPVFNRNPPLSFCGGGSSGNTCRGDCECNLCLSRSMASSRQYPAQMLIYHRLPLVSSGRCNNLTPN